MAKKRHWKDTDDAGAFIQRTYYGHYSQGPFFGHYIPFLEFAKKAVSFHNVTIVMPKSKLADIQRRNLTPPSPVQLAIIEDNPTVNPDTDFSVRAMGELIGHLTPLYKDFVEKVPFTHDPLGRDLGRPDTVDVAFVDWCAPPVVFSVFHNRNLPVYLMSTFTPSLTFSILKADENTPTFPDEVFTSGRVLPRDACCESLKAPQVERNEELTKCQGVVITTFPEMDPAWLKLAAPEKELPVPVHFIGPSLPTAPPKTTLSTWLDKQDKSSVIYVAFGSIGKVSTEQLSQIGEALLQLGKPCIWALRPFQSQDLPAKFQGYIKDEVDESASFQILPWISQQEILSHDATSVFISHCGWNSASEAAFYGVPVVAWPFFGDQPEVSVILEQLGMGVRVGKTGLDSKTVISKDQLVQAVEKVGGWSDDSKDEYGRSAKRMSTKAHQETGPGGISSAAFGRLMEELKRSH